MAAKQPIPKSPITRPERPANLSFGRWLGDFEPLSKVERRLVQHCAHGELFSLGKGQPEKPLAKNKIRAGIIRFLLLGGDAHNPVHDEGIMVEGAWVDGSLNLHRTRCQVGLLAQSCRFDSQIFAAEAKIPALQLIGSSIPGLIADRVRVIGSVMFSYGFTSTGAVSLIGGEIGGDFDCRKGSFSNNKSDSLVADRLIVKGGMYLSEGFTATGAVRLYGASIEGNFSCGNGSFFNESGDAIKADGIRVKGAVFLRRGFTATGGVRLLGAEIGGILSCVGGTFTNAGGKALNLDTSKIRGSLFLRRGSFAGDVDLSEVTAASLVDDQAQYKDTILVLDAFRYSGITGPTDAASRIEWLAKQRPAHLADDFRPQPWEQLIRVLRDMGHPAEAAKIAMAKQNALRAARQIGLRRPDSKFSGWRLTLDKSWSIFSNFLARRLHWLYGWIAGYGHRPTRIVWRMVLVCILCSLAYYGGRYQGLIGPSAPVIQLHERTRNCGTGGDLGKIPWTSPKCPVPPEYSTFQPFFYSLDVIIPFVDLHQETDWSPVVTNRAGETLWWGRVLRWIMWFEIIFGWIASVMFVAIIGRLVDKD